MIVTDQLTAWQCGECTELFRKIGMRDGDTVIDFGCGVGNYAFAASEVVGPSGQVFALDIDPDVLNHLKSETLARNTPHLHPYASHEDATMGFADDFANVILIYDLIHQTDIRQRFLEESRRVLVPGGTLSILPFHMNRDETRSMLQQAKAAGFKRADTLVNCGLHFALDKVFSDSPESITDLERDTIYNFINRNALVFQTKWDIDDWYDNAQIKRAKKAHNEAMLRVIERMKQRGCHGLMAGANCCSLCERCARLDEAPCPFPGLRFSCLSAYCVYVKKLADACGMEYACKDGRLAFFGLYAF